MSTASTVEFDYRFDRDFGVHEEKLAVRRELAAQFGVAFAGSDVEKVQLYPVSRAGKSGSEVFYLDLFRRGVSFAARFVAKFQNKHDTQKEWESARYAEHAGMCSKVFTYQAASADLGMIVYNLASSADHIEFRGFFLDPARAPEDCGLALAAIFRTVGSQPNTAAAAKPLMEDFAWYVQRKTEPLQRIESLIASGPTYSPIGRLAESIRAHLSRIKNEMNVDVHPYLVHGDLHARNLMLSAANPSRAELIDFGWVHFGHPAKDFVLMEATLKYMLLPELLPILRGSAKDQLYLSAEHVEAFEKFLCRHGFDLPKADVMEADVFKGAKVPAHQMLAVRRVYICLVELRQYAGRVLRSYCALHPTPSGITAERHYFASFFLATFGLLGMSEVDPIWSLIGLHTAGDQLWKP